MTAKKQSPISKKSKPALVPVSSEGRERWIPKPYQKKAVRFGLESSAAGFFLDPGLGKTSISLAILSVLRNEGIGAKALIVAPLRPVYETWPEEIEKWAEFSDTRYAILHGPKKGQALASDADVYLINPEGLSWLFSKIRGRFPFDVLIVDESTKFKNTRTLRFKLLRDYLPKFGRRYILTGRPAPNGLMDLFGQVYIMDLGRSLGRYITHFRNEFFNSTGFGGYTYVPKGGAEKRIQEAISPYVLVMSQEDYLSLPPLVNVTRKIKLPPLARKQYDVLEDTFMLMLDGGTVNAANAAVAGQKLRQIANGGIYIGAGAGDSRPFEAIHDAKSEELIDLLEELSGQPTLVAYEFHHDLVRIRAALKAAGFGDVPYIGGGVSTARFREIKDAWNRGEIPVLLAQPESVAHGLNLQKTGRAVIWYGLTWNLETYYQFIRRIWRQGQTERVFNYHLVAEGTTDEAMMRALDFKDRNEKTLLAALKEYRKARQSPREAVDEGLRTFLKASRKKNG